MFQTFAQYFSEISLDELNQKAAMLERRENKYILSLENLLAYKRDLNEHFDILSIEGKKDFLYETIYFDDKNSCFDEHRQGKRQRFKVRTRKYIDADICFFEMKLKDARNATIKKRMTHPVGRHGYISSEGITALELFYKQMYKKDFSYDLTPAIKMQYARITLVAKKGGERMTIDYNLCFFDRDNHMYYRIPKDLAIIETKSHNGKGIADGIFKQQRQKSVSCSKFCLGKIAHGDTQKINHFLPMIKKYFPDILSLSLTD